MKVGATGDEEPEPTTIGRYRVEGVLGEGAFGRVYLASDLDLERSVAIKVPRRNCIAHESDLEAYLDEARVVAQLNHPNIVPVYDVGTERNGSCYVVSRYIEGCDLRDWLKRSSPSFRESAELIRQIAEALHAAHERDLVHRDVKPANILVDNSGTPYVCDFGLALRDVDFGRGDIEYAGTPAYMSPEQARGEGSRVDGRSDVFSLGVVFYELLTGRRPFYGKNHVELLNKISSTNVRPPRQRRKDIPRELERICLQALARNVSDRYTTASDMADDLRRSINPSLVSTIEPTRIQEPSSPRPTTRSALLAPLKPYMANRKLHEENIERVIHSSRDDATGKFHGPVVLIMQGTEGQGHHTFISRLRESLLPRVFRLSRHDQAVHDVHVEFPREGTQNEESARHSLLMRVSQKLHYHDDKMDESKLAKQFCHTQHGPVLVHTQLFTPDLATSGQNKIGTFLKFWDELPYHPMCYAPVICLSIKYIQRRGFQGWRLKRQNARIRSFFDDLSKFTENIQPLVLPELQDLQQSHVEDWLQEEFDLEQRLELQPHVSELFSRVSTIKMEDFATQTKQWCK